MKMSPSTAEHVWESIIMYMVQRFRIPLLSAVFVFACTILSAQDAPLKIRSVLLRGLKPTRCDRLKVQFLDEATLLISNAICAKGGVESTHQHTLARLDGQIIKSVELGQGSRYAYIGPPEYLLFPADHDGWLIYNTNLEPQWRVPIPSGEFPGGIALSPSHNAVAISSSTVDYKTYHWQLFSGNPLTKMGDFAGPLPFPGITDAGAIEPTFSGKQELGRFEPNTGELWFFDSHYQLTRRVNGVETMLPEASWLAPLDSSQTWCHKDLSAAQPRHILISCQSSHYLPRAIGGLLTHGLPLYHLRYVVYDATGKALLRGEYPFDSPPSLSSSGHLLVITQGKKIILYDLP